MERLESHASFGGVQEVWEHASSALGLQHALRHLPATAGQHATCPVLYWLSGLTCTEQNFITKSGAQRYRRRTRRDPGGARHQSARRGHAGRRGLRHRPGRGVLCQRHAGALARALPHARLRGRRTAGAGRPVLRDELRAGDQRTFDGRPRCADDRAAQSGSLSQRVGVLADRGAVAGAVGQEGVLAPTWATTARRGANGTHRADRDARANACRCWSTRATPTNSWPRSCGRTCCRPRVPPRAIRCSCACSLATTTAITSSPVSSASTSPGMPRRCMAIRRPHVRPATGRCRRSGRRAARSRPRCSGSGCANIGPADTQVWNSPFSPQGSHLRRQRVQQ